MITDEMFEWIVVSVLEHFPGIKTNDFLDTPEHMLILYHSSVGRTIRNEYGLWEYDWAPEIVDGIDVSANHPDAVSMRIIREVWKRANEERNTK